MQRREQWQAVAGSQGGMVRLRELWPRFGTAFILLVMVVAMSITSPRYFFTTTNLVQIVLQSSITIIIAVGQLLVILIAGIDLSVGSAVAVTGLATGVLLKTHWPVVPALALGGVALGALIGAINGLLTVYTKLPPFIITLGTLSIFRGLALILTDARPVFGFPRTFARTVGGWLGPFPMPALIALGVAALFYLVVARSRLGYDMYAMGGNLRAAWLAGIPVPRRKIQVYTLAGLLAGVAGILTTARVGAAEPLAGTGYELQAIAATVIGGTSFFGGVGSVGNTVLGALIMGVIANALNIMAVPAYYQQVVTGAVIIVAVLLNRSLAGRTKEDLTA